MAEPEKISGLRALWRALRSWRTASVTLLSFSSGMPLGLIWIAVPDWMATIGVDIRVIGLITLAQAPWTFKFLWSPLMDRFAPPFWGRRRGWMAIAQVVLFALGLALAGVGSHPDTPWVVAALALAIAFAAASQDIAYDAYVADVLRPEEQGVAVGAKTAVYRLGMLLAGGAAISLAGTFGWAAVNIGLACLYLPMLVLTWLAPEPEEKTIAPRTMREAVWLPFLGFLARHRALEILAFVVFYKFADNFAQALLRPFLVDLGYSAVDRGVALATIGAFATVGGALLGGVLTTVIGLGPALWIFGFLQIFSNVGYVLLVDAGVHRPLMYGALGFESFTQGLGTGAFSVLLLRLTQRRFSATQYALFSSLFGISRLLTGPIAGVTVDAIGWKLFFWLTMATGIPGMLLLARFVPFGVREPEFTIEPPHRREPLSAAGLVARGTAGAAIGLVGGVLLRAALGALKTMRGTPEAAFDLAAALERLMHPQTPSEWAGPIGLLAFALVCGLFTAAIAAARRGAAAEAE